MGGPKGHKFIRNTLVKEVQVLYTENYSEETDAEPLIWYHSLRMMRD